MGIDQHFQLGTITTFAPAHIGQRQARRACYRGTRNNSYDLRRAASIQNLELAQRAAAA